MNPAKILSNPNWTQEQKDRFEHLEKSKNAILAYWNSDNNGFPVNGGKSRSPAKPGLIQNIRKKIIPCSTGFHASFRPGDWKGDKTWVCALSGHIIKEDMKMISSKREIIGEVNFDLIKDLNVLEKYLKSSKPLIQITNVNSNITIRKFNSDKCNILNSEICGTLSSSYLSKVLLENNNFKWLLILSNYFNCCSFYNTSINENLVKNCYFHVCKIPKSWKRKVLISNGCKFYNCEYV